MENKKYFGVMVDMSRNAVMSVDALKRFIDYIASFGYNSLQLYTEDTYEVNGEPYFGHLRGRYSKDEIKELDAHCISKGIELIPCIQTLAHLNAIFRWHAYDKVHDIEDILLVDDDNTYKLIENMFATLAECYTSKNVHIGMDEAHLLGRGKFFDLHGNQNRFEILHRHLLKVAKIAKAHGFEPMMWSDMFFKFATKSNNYYSEDFVATDEVKEAAKCDTALVFWDYYHDDKAVYDRMLAGHKQLSDNVWFAGGAWTWTGFVPNTKLAFKNTVPALQSCRDNGIDKIFITLWGDDGAECSMFSVLPVLFRAIKEYNGCDISTIKEEFFKLTGEDYDAMVDIGCPNEICGNKDNMKNPSKYMFYNDLLSGLYDSVFDLSAEKEWKMHAKKLYNYAKNSPNFAYLFNEAGALCEFLSVKAGLGIKLRAAYEKGDKEELKKLARLIRKAETKLDKFYVEFRKLWNNENKPFGFDVQDIRIGGLMLRMRSCREKILSYVNGEISVIEEFEQPLLDVEGDENGEKRVVFCGLWKNSVTRSNL